MNSHYPILIWDNGSNRNSYSLLLEASLAPAMEEGRVEAAMAAVDDNDEGASLTNSLLGDAWMAVASQYILKRSRLKQKIQQEEGIRKKRKGGWHPKSLASIFSTVRT